MGLALFSVNNLFLFFYTSGAIPPQFPIFLGRLKKLKFSLTTLSARRNLSLSDDDIWTR